jgi:predicted Zn-dependent protease
MLKLQRPLSLLLGVLLAGVGTLAQAQLLVSEKEIMRQASTEWLLMKKHTPQYGDERIQRYARCIANQLIDVLDPEWKDLRWEVIVFDNDELNAFVLPGGKIAVYSGIMRVADNPDALAAVLGHEIAHMTEGHVLARARQSQRVAAGAIIGSAATGLPRDWFEAGGTFGALLPFARAQESEADQVGLEYMAKAGFDPRAALQLWQNMQLEAEGRNQPPQWMSTHPREEQRLDSMVPLLVSNLKLYNDAQEAGHVPNCYPR